MPGSGRGGWLAHKLPGRLARTLPDRRARCVPAPRPDAGARRAEYPRSDQDGVWGGLARSVTDWWNSRAVTAWRNSGLCARHGKGTQ